jgi:hypothetical protein
LSQRSFPAMKGHHFISRFYCYSNVLDRGFNSRMKLIDMASASADERLLNRVAASFMQSSQVQP